ncbi:uracil-DNA glycosylase [Bacillus sp. FJAT-44742]|uniref:uracil-DNA glycosylase n=1 Tax=Bacillus sp. FJAT-44742 TaxID=2014005 RepID=UPI000C23C2F4|nr:uracil-DNA glycosylase [Bacillus sp. FJAT-44742]
MEIPQVLIDTCKKRMEPYPAEGFLIGGGNPQADVLFVGEAPGEHELISKQPFTGRAGKELDKFLESAGISREDVYITSAVRSRPYKIVRKQKGEEIVIKRPNRKPTKKEIIAHAPILDYQIEKIDPTIIVTLGGVAYERLTGKKDKMTEIHGEAQKTRILKLKNTTDNTLVYGMKEYILFPFFHPASVFYNRKLEEMIYEDAKALAALIQHETS